eukprot:TRINITY_DN27479_c0_g1_i1.p1 TRINITY_DN27479_c0_g1~~TRINITY_DN27479_c0_g1_i1.p1  ORF type:complete len:724 (+),score=234.84 TRINITY_DN27479_c0_g1_i1:70-2241(+)
MGQVPSVGDVVTVQPDLEALKAGVLAKPGLEWGDAYTQAAGKKGEVLDVEGGKEGTVTLAVGKDRLELTVPCKCICKPDDDDEGKDIIKVELPRGTSVRIATSLARIREEVERYPDDLSYDEALFKGVAGKQAVVLSIDDGFYDLRLLVGEVPPGAVDTVCLPRSLIAPLSKKPRSVDPHSVNPLGTGAIQSPVAQAHIRPSDSVTIAADRAHVKASVGKHPEDLQWDEEAMAPALGAAGRVVDIDGMLISVELPGGAVVTVPRDVVRRVDDPQTPSQSPAARRAVETPTEDHGHIYSPQSAPVDPPDTPGSASPPLDTPTQTRSPFGAAGLQEGSKVQVTANVRFLEAEVRKHPDDLEWCADTLAPALGKTGVVVGVEDGVRDVRLDTGVVVCVPATALSVPGPSSGAAAAAAPLKVGDAVSVTGDKAALRREVAQYPDDIEWDEGAMAPAVGKTGVVVEVDDDLLDVKLDGAGTVVTVPKGALARPGAAAVARGPKRGDRVVVTSSVVRLKMEVERFPDDMEWSADMEKAVGQGAVVDDVDGELFDVRLESTQMLVTIPVKALNLEGAAPTAPERRKPASLPHTSPPKQQPSKPKPAPVFAPAAPAPPVLPPPSKLASSEPSRFSVGDEVEVVESISVLKLHVIKSRDRIEWDEALMSAVMGCTGRVTACDGKFIDVAVSTDGQPVPCTFHEESLTLCNPPPQADTDTQKKDDQGCKCLVQ